VDDAPVADVHILRLLAIANCVGLTIRLTQASSATSGCS
jgi:hypothetical protein